MIRHVLIGSGLGLGLWLMLRGMFPAPMTLSERLTRHAAMDLPSTDRSAIGSLWGRIATWLLAAVKGETMDQVECDVAVTDSTLEAHAIDKLNAGLGGGGLLAVLGLMFGIVASPVAVLLVVGAGFIVCYLLPDAELKRRAAARREEFAEALNAFVRLVAVAISGGGGVNSAMYDATAIGNGWCFDALGRSISEATLHGESPWAGFDDLGRKLGLVPLIELAGALSLAGTSGARVTETLKARAEAGRERELAEAMTHAEKKSETMNIPVAAMVLGWVGFMGYPAVANLLGT